MPQQLLGWCRERAFSSAESAHLDGLERQAWPDLDECDALLLHLFLVQGHDDLVVAQPDAVITPGEGDDMVNEWLGFGVAFGRHKHLLK